MESESESLIFPFHKGKKYLSELRPGVEDTVAIVAFKEFEDTMVTTSKRRINNKQPRLTRKRGKVCKRKTNRERRATGSEADDQRGVGDANVNETGLPLNVLGC